MMKMWGKAFMLSIRRKSPTTMSTGLSSGSSTWQKICQREAPSMAAASSGSSGIICSAASTARNTKGNHSHTSAMMMAQSARVESVSHAGCGSPTSPSAQFSTLTSGVKRIFQVSATTTGGRTIGMMKAARTASTPRIRVCSRRASPRPMRSWSSTVQKESRACTHTEFQKRSSRSSSR